METLPPRILAQKTSVYKSAVLVEYKGSPGEEVAPSFSAISRQRLPTKTNFKSQHRFKTWDAPDQDDTAKLSSLKCRKTGTEASPASSPTDRCGEKAGGGAVLIAGGVGRRVRAPRVLVQELEPGTHLWPTSRTRTLVIETPQPGYPEEK